MKYPYSLLKCDNNLVVCLVATRLLTYWYSNQQMFVCWQNCSSGFFRIANGVRQGSILSPLVVCVIFDIALQCKNSIISYKYYYFSSFILFSSVVALVVALLLLFTVMDLRGLMQINK